MFNLGYLPGGDKRITTRAATTVRALADAARLVTPGGLLTALVYRGHPGGPQEAAAVEAASRDLLTRAFAVERYDSPGPILFVLRRTAAP